MSPRMGLLLACLMVVLVPPCAWGEEMFVYFGSHRSGPGIGFSLARFDTVTGVLTKPEFLLEAAAPAFFVIDAGGKHLYTSNSIDTYNGKQEGTITSYSIDPKTATLALLNVKPAGGSDPSFISLDKTGKFALDANYRGGNICVYAIQPDGSFGERTAFVQHTGKSIDPQRQTRPYAHAIITDPSNRFALVPDLGVDKVFIYRFDQVTGSLIPNDPPHIDLKPGSGPRHVRFHPNGKWVYVLTEMGNTINVFNWDGAKGSLQLTQSALTVPETFTGTSTSAEIEVHPTGSFVYTSNRGHDSLAVYRVDPENGSLLLLQLISSGGKTPRNFALDPTGKWIICTNHGSDNAVVFAIDGQTGRLTQKGDPISVPYPFCQRFLPVPPAP